MRLTGRAIMPSRAAISARRLLALRQVIPDGFVPGDV
jgi:hypothetical protein